MLKSLLRLPVPVWSPLWSTVHVVPVNQSDDDVLHVDVLMKLRTGTQERIQGLEVKLVRENLQTDRSLIYTKLLNKLNRQTSVNLFWCSVEFKV